MRAWESEKVSILTGGGDKSVFEHKGRYSMFLTSTH